MRMWCNSLAHNVEGSREDFAKLSLELEPLLSAILDNVVCQVEQRQLAVRVSCRAGAGTIIQLLATSHKSYRLVSFSPF